MNRASGFAHALRACWASFFCQSMQKNPKNLSLAKAPACGGSPRIRSGAGSVLLGPGGGRSTHCANTRNGSTPGLHAPLAQTALAFPPALRSDTRSLVSARSCDARCLRGSNVKTTGVRLVVLIARVGARHSLVFPRPTHSPEPDAVDAAECAGNRGFAVFGDSRKERGRSAV
jgi:hypothetical protein